MDGEEAEPQDPPPTWAIMVGTYGRAQIKFRALLEEPLVPLAREETIKTWIPIVVCNMDEMFALEINEFGDPLS